VFTGVHRLGAFVTVHCSNNHHAYGFATYLGLLISGIYELEMDGMTFL